MSILEILEAHLRVMGQRGTSVLCICGWHAVALGKRSEDLHRAHVAQVLAQHVLEAKAEVLTNAAAEYERLCRIGDTPQSQVTDEETQEFWIWHAKTTDEWLRDLAAQIRSGS